MYIVSIMWVILLRNLQLAKLSRVIDTLDNFAILVISLFWSLKKKPKNLKTTYLTNPSEKEERFTSVISTCEFSQQTKRRRRHSRLLSCFFGRRCRTWNVTFSVVARLTDISICFEKVAKTQNSWWCFSFVCLFFLFKVLFPYRYLWWF